MRRLTDRTLIVWAYVLVVLGGAAGTYLVHHQQQEFQHRVCTVVVSMTGAIPSAPADQQDNGYVARLAARNQQLAAQRSELLAQLGMTDKC